MRLPAAPLSAQNDFVILSTANMPDTAASFHPYWDDRAAPSRNRLEREATRQTRSLLLGFQLPCFRQRGIIGILFFLSTPGSLFCIYFLNSEAVGAKTFYFAFLLSIIFVPHALLFPAASMAFSDRLDTQ